MVLYWLGWVFRGAHNLPILDTEKDTLKDHEVDCATLTLQYDGMRTISLNTPTQTTPISQETPVYSCQKKKTCSTISSCDEAYFYLGSCGFSSLDKNNDGVPCESLCN